MILHLEFEVSQKQNLLLFEGTSAISLLKSSADWVRPTYIMEEDLFYSTSGNLNVNLT